LRRCSFRAAITTITCRAGVCWPSR
jgi:hypothetical protein